MKNRIDIPMVTLLLKISIVILVILYIAAFNYGGCKRTKDSGSSIANKWSKIDSGEKYSIALKDDDKLWAWGSNYYGQLGNGTLENDNTLNQITDTTWSKISAGAGHVAAIRSNGTLWTWGNNEWGQLGDGSRTNKNIPTQIAITVSTWSKIAAGSNHTIAIKGNNTLWVWGNNSDGQLGDGTLIIRNTPTPIVITTSNWSNIACGANHTIAIKSDGTLWAWGNNFFGQLGDGTTVYKNLPTQITTGTNWSKISAGWYHTIALQSNGTLWTWGYNYYGQLGDGSTDDKNMPTQIAITTTNWTDIAGGAWHTLALKDDGGLWTWGYNLAGQLGDGTNTDKYTPTHIDGTNWSMIKAGKEHSIALKSDGTLWTWGDNSTGELGNSTHISSKVPIQIGQ
jgi:alpha-tubulin suppressor-like RCC1 family protein